MTTTEQQLRDYACQIARNSGTVIIAGGVGSLRADVLRTMAYDIESAGDTVTATTIAAHTPAEHLAALCEMTTPVLGLGDLHLANPLPALLASETGTGLIASYLAVGPSAVLQGLTESCQRDGGLNERTALSVVNTHIDLIITCDSRRITAAHHVASTGETTGVYTTGGPQPKLMLPEQRTIS